MDTEQMEQSAKILIADDMLPNREVLHDFIEVMGYEPIMACNGLEVLEQLKIEKADLILLDILMPEMDGYEVLEQLKEDNDWRHIPVIVISAVDERDSLVRCIQMGADDYLTKPFDSTLLRTRIHASLEKKRLRDQEEAYRRQIEEYGLHLEGLVYEKTQQLAEAYEKLQRLDQAKNEFLRLISHEMRTPLNGLMGSADMLFRALASGQPNSEVQHIFESSLERFVEIVNQAQLLTRLEVSPDMMNQAQSQINSVIRASLNACAQFAEHRNVKLHRGGKDENLLVHGEESLLINALNAMLRTAVRFSRNGNPVDVIGERDRETYRIDLRVNGWTVPEKFLENFFELFSITDSIVPGGDIGLGPPLAARIMELYGGTLRVVNQADPEGVIFTLELPVTKP